MHSFLGEPLHYEAEISFIVKNNQFIAVAMGMDLTKRGIQSNLKAASLPWERCKAFDGSALFSPFVSIQTINPALKVELSIDGELAQTGGVELMIHKPDEIIEDINSFITLNDGDIVMTGTPKGVGEVISGKQYSGRIMQNDEVITSIDWVAL